jgi:hypothetical protein
MKQQNITDLSSQLFDKLVEDLPYGDEDNATVAQAVKEFILEHPSRIHDFIGGILEDDEENS